MRSGPWHILLIDDDDVTNFLSREMLRLSVPDAVVVAMQNGREALDFLQNGLRGQDTLPDIILLDINMPVMDGWDFLEGFDKLKSSADPQILDAISIFMFTSSVYYEDMNKAKSFPSVRNIFSKPLDENRISEILESSSR
ncbi:response regulator [Sediminibacterium ginsengisoli]|uniref:Response regulator receiver domain-containing protein n=1 Tax=Sediminibacterium ginsengisoli TaxID=413434 RepID=A0A1T4QGG5_9BACT|nr:response regulator [Sediminibacterium ginsengisoli]SKA02809.1 Response regulator receiver domain-containing protein [Sediminibacterium ginsengisoli]